MRQSVCLLAIGAILLAAGAFRIIDLRGSLADAEHPHEQLSLDFAAWRLANGKIYSSPTELKYRLEVFRQQSAYIARINQEYEQALLLGGDQKPRQPMFAVNQFADLTDEEFEAMYTDKLASTGNNPIEGVRDIRSYEELPERRQEINPREDFKPKVRSQGVCSGAWAFSAIIDIEQRMYLARQENVELSVQRIIDCDSYSQGCNGGYPERAFLYSVNKGCHKVADYPPYVAYNSICEEKRPGSISLNRLTVTRHIGFNFTLTQKLQERGFLPVLTLKSSGKFRYLSDSTEVFKARFSGECDFTINHYVTQIDVKDGAIRVLNSWGESWGEKGLKWIEPCTDSNFYGVSGRMSFCFDI